MFRQFLRGYIISAALEGAANVVYLGLVRFKLAGAMTLRMYLNAIFFMELFLYFECTLEERNMRYTKFFAILSIMAVLALTACGTKNSGGGVGKLTVKNLPSSGILLLNAFVFNATSFPAPDGSMVGGSSDPKPNPPYSPISLINYPLTSTFTGSGSFLVRVTIVTDGGKEAKVNIKTEKYTVAKFSNGSATIDWNAMTAKEDKE